MTEDDPEEFKDMVKDPTEPGQQIYTRLSKAEAPALWNGWICDARRQQPGIGSCMPQR